MADIFISYASINRKIAEQVVRRLKAEGYSVYMDRHASVTHEPARKRLLREIDAATAVIGLWSRKALTDSDYVPWECEAALKSGKLIAVEIEKLDRIRDVPPELRGPLTIELKGFKGQSKHPGWLRLHQSLQHAFREKHKRPPPLISAPPDDMPTHYEPPTTRRQGRGWLLVSAALLLACVGYLASAHYYKLWPFAVQETTPPPTARFELPTSREQVQICKNGGCMEFINAQCRSRGYSEGALNGACASAHSSCPKVVFDCIGRES